MCSLSPYPVSRVPSETTHGDGPYQKGGLANAAEESRDTFHTHDGSDGAPSRGSQLLEKDTRSRKPVNGIESFTKQERDEMEELLKDVRGHLGECHPFSPIINLFSYPRSCVSLAILGRRGCCRELHLQCRQVCCITYVSFMLFTVARMLPLPIYA